MITLDDLGRARRVLRGVTEHTRLIYSHTLSRMLGGHIYLKPELFQRTGSFKLRGASVKIASLTGKERGVIAASAGNHAQGVAVAATRKGIRSVIVMPESSPRAKAEAARGYGAEVVLYGPSYNDAYQFACALTAERGYTMIPAFDDPHVIAGQGTVGLEILEDLPDVDDIVVPVGGGGLASGVAVAARALKPSIRVIGVQAAGASSLISALEAGRPIELTSVQTIADGIAVKQTGGPAVPNHKGIRRPGRGRWRRVHPEGDHPVDRAGEDRRRGGRGRSARRSAERSSSCRRPEGRTGSQRW